MANPARTILDNQEGAAFSDLLTWATSTGQENDHKADSPATGEKDGSTTEPATLAWPGAPTTPACDLHHLPDSSPSWFISASTDHAGQTMAFASTTSTPGGTLVKTMTDTSMGLDHRLADIPGLPAPNGESSESLISRQLQSLLQGHDQDAITIRTPSSQTAAAESLPALTSAHLQTAESGPTPTMESPSSPVGLTTQASTDRADALRQEMGRHGMETQTEPSTEQGQTGNHQPSSKQQENSARPGHQSDFPATGMHGTTEPTGQFIVTGLGTQTTATAPGHGATTHPAHVATAVPIPAEELINHLVERFSVNPRLQTSKVSLNLSPAELGRLHIDIMVKGDSIKAHISAGSQQIRESIERHMPRLKTVLEQQGFTIEDLQVTLDSTATDGHDHFQQQFSSRQEFTPQSTAAANRRSPEVLVSPTEEPQSETKDAGINLSI